jgi:iron complex outermembrane recepter protein
VPNIGSYQSANADASAIQPQTSFNRQVGVVHESDKVKFDADVYYISFNNKIATMPGSPAAQPILYNQGGVDYSGAEVQLSYVMGGGFSVSANGSLNRASKRDTGMQIAGVPNTTSALGLLYGSGPFNATLFYKRVGTTYALDDQAYSLSAYSTTDLGVSYKFVNPGAMAKNLKLQLTVANLFNRESIIAVSPTNTKSTLPGYGAPTATDFFGWQPPRSVMTTVRGEF